MPLLYRREKNTQIKNKLEHERNYIFKFITHENIEVTGGGQIGARKKILFREHIFLSSAGFKRDALKCY